MYKKGLFDHWVIAFRRGGDKPFQLVRNPSWGWCADPFLVRFHGKLYLFAEAYLYKSERKGVLVYCEYNGEQFGEWIVTMDEHYHLSYPNIFVQEGELYLCPERHQCKDIALFRLKKSPNVWERTKILVDNGRFVDSTFLEWKQKRYLFTFSLDNTGGCDGSLFLFEERNGKYYKSCKLSSDRRSARPGGNFLEENGNIIRVAQNCEDYYGQGLVFLKVDQIEPIYKEHEIRQMNPAEIEVVNGGSYLGIHTYNRLEDMEVIDLMYQEYTEEEALAQKRVREVFCDKFR